MELSKDSAGPTHTKLALALSGGGKRAALFQCGSIMALAAVGRLQDVALVSAISGGSLTALALKRAFAENHDKSAGTNEVGIAWAVYDILSREVAPHDFRGEGLLAAEHVCAFLAAGEMRLTEAVAKQIHRHLKGIDIDIAGPDTHIGVCELGTKKLVGIPLKNDNASIASAAAMALPGIFDAVPVKPFGAVIDGGVVDKTGLQLLTDKGWEHEVVLIDASQAAKVHPQTRCSSMAGLKVTFEVEAEALRPQLIEKYGSRLKKVSLRDGPIPGLDNNFVEQLKGLRTDLDHFSPVETDSLIIAGFIATCGVFGDSPQQSYDRLGEFSAAKHGFSRNVEKLSRGIKSLNGTVVDQPTNDRIVEILKIGKDGVMKEIFSNHPYLRLSGIFSFLAAPIIFTYVLLLLFALPFALGAFIAEYSKYSLLPCVVASTLVFGIITTIYLRTKADKPFGIVGWIVLTISAPSIIALAEAWRYAIQRVKISSAVSSVAYPLGFLGRLWEMVDLREHKGQPFTYRTMLQILAIALLLILLLVNPFFMNPGMQNLLPSGESFASLREFITCPFLPVTLITILAAEYTLVALTKINAWFK